MWRRGENFLNRFVSKFIHTIRFSDSFVKGSLLVTSDRSSETMYCSATLQQIYNQMQQPTSLGLAITTFIFQMQTKYRRCNRAKNGGSTRICKKTQIKRRSCNKRRCCEFYPNSIITMSKRRQKCSIKAWVPEKVVLFWSFTKPFPRSSNVLMAREGPGTRMNRCPLPGRETSV